MASALQPAEKGPLRPKVVALYDKLFQESHQPGYWVEFFLLPVNEPALNSRLAETPKDVLLQNSVVIRTLVAAAVVNLGSSQRYIVNNALAILRVVIRHLAGERRLTSAELLEMLSGLGTVDKVLDELTDRLLDLVRAGNQESVRFLVVCGASVAGTSLAQVLTQKNLFSALVTFIDRWDPDPPPDSDPEISDDEDEFEVTEADACRAFVAIGILSNLGKFDDGADMYGQRISEFIDEDIIAKFVRVAEGPLRLCIDNYSQQLSPRKSWLGWLKTTESTQIRHIALEIPDAAVLLAVYEFTAHNELFAAQLSASPTLRALVMLSTHFLSNSHKDTRAHAYGRLCVLIFRILVETQLPALTEYANYGVFVVSTQRQPALSVDRSSRPPLAGLLDATQAGLRFNIGKGADLDLYCELATVVYQALASMATKRVGIGYHWPQLWQTLLSVLKYFVEAGATEVVVQLSDVVAGAVLRRDLYDADDWDSLYFKVVQSPQIFEELGSFPSGRALKAMAAQFSLLAVQDPERDWSSEVLRQGISALGTRPLGMLRPRYSELKEQRFLRRLARVAFSDAETL